MAVQHSMHKHTHLAAHKIKLDIEYVRQYKARYSGNTIGDITTVAVEAKFNIENYTKLLDGG